MAKAQSRSDLETLQARLEEAEETLQAIRSGAVDALVVSSLDGEQVYTLKGADHSYRLLLQEMNEGAATLTFDGTILYGNRRFAEIAGAPLEKIIGAPIADFVAPGDRALLDGLLARGKESRAKAEIVFGAEEGAHVPAYCSVNPIDLDGIECLGLVVTDLTEQKRNEDIVASEKLARHILERAVDVIVVCDEAGKITHASRAAHDLAGVDVLRESFASVFPIVDAKGEPLSCAVETEMKGNGSLVANCLGGSTVQGLEVRFRRPDGKIFELLLSAGPLRDVRQRSRGCVFTLTDITRLKVTEEELRESQAQLSAELNDTKLLQRISAELINEEKVENLYEKILDTAVAVMRSDFASMQMLYPERGEGGELRLLAFRGFNPEGAAFWEWVRADSQSTCGAALRAGVRVVAADIEKCDFMAGTEDLATYRDTGIRAVQSTPLLSRGGKIVGMISTHWRRPHEPSERDLRLFDILARQTADLIERKRAEEALRESEERLRRQAQELEQQLIASGRLVSLGEITASMAHEFNNPLGIAMGFAEDLLSEKAVSDSDYQPLKIIHEETKRCQKIIEDLLEYSRPRPTERRTVAIEEIVRKGLQLVSNHLYKQKIKDVVEIEPEVGEIQADPQQIEQVLVNLYLNAIDAMPEGGTLTVRVKRHDGANGVAISVSDDGIGIVAEDLGNIFQPFFSRRKKSGLGLGLPICKRIVINHGGTIEAESRTMEGATFKIYLPRESDLPREERPSEIAAGS